jgi:hypothetical protein
MDANEMPLFESDLFGRSNDVPRAALFTAPAFFLPERESPAKLAGGLK